MGNFPLIVNELVPQSATEFQLWASVEKEVLVFESHSVGDGGKT